MIKPKRIRPGRMIALSFVVTILIGTGLLALPFSRNPGVAMTLGDIIFTATSAVCVNGLLTHSIADTFSVFGRIIIAVLIQIGGLGVTAIGVGFISLTRQKVNLRERILIKESLNYDTVHGIVGLIKSVLLVTVSIELIGTVLSMFVFTQQFGFWDALGLSAFHAISAFNNAGFDLFGNTNSLEAFADNPYFLLVTSALIILGGLGFIVIREVLGHRRNKRFSLHSKVVLTMTGSLLVIGTVHLYFAADLSWLHAFFYSVSARTAGFTLGPMRDMTAAGVFFMMMLMFIGAAPGSTGGGIKVTTLFTVMHAVFSAATNTTPSAFKRKLAPDIIYKSLLLTLISSVVVIITTLILLSLEPEVGFFALLLESVSAFSTVGISMELTDTLRFTSKFILVLVMYIGRLGPLFVASLWVYKPASNVSYAPESLGIG